MIIRLYETYKQGTSYPNRHLLLTLVLTINKRLRNFRFVKHKAHINAVRDYFHKGKQTRFQYVLNPTAVSVGTLRFDTSKLPSAGILISLEKLERLFRVQSYKEKFIYANKKQKKYAQTLAYIKKKAYFCNTK